MKKEEEKDTGFPITNVGNDREGKTGMTEKEEEKDPGFPITNVGNDREGKTGMTEKEEEKDLDSRLQMSGMTEREKRE